MKDFEKAYKEALERARQFSEHPLQEDSSNIVEYIFTELERSKDEKIRKALIEYFDDMNKADSWANGIHPLNIIAWLEKQKDAYELGFTEGKRVKNKEWLEKQKPVKWAEEDEDMINAAIRTCKYMVDHLRTLQNRMSMLLHG